MSTEHTAAPAIADMSEQMQIRLEKRAKLIESGREAYPVGLLDSEGNRVEPTTLRICAPSTIRSWLLRS